MKVVGIDPGLQICGYACLQSDQTDQRLVEAGVLRTDAAFPVEVRLNQIAADIESILKKFNPETAAVEQLYSHYAHPQTAVLMGHARGVILQKCAQLGIAVESFSATRIKKSISGNGRASKQQMQKAIQTILALAGLPEPPDVADAIAVALCCANSQTKVTADNLL